LAFFRQPGDRRKCFNLPSRPLVRKQLFSSITVNVVGDPVRSPLHRLSAHDRLSSKRESFEVSVYKQSQRIRSLNLISWRLDSIIQALHMYMLKVFSQN
jgi:hypothetical protein